MKPIDYFILFPLIYGALEGYRKGFVLMVVGFLALILGVIGAFKLLQLGVDFLLNFFPQMPKILPLLSFILIFCLIIIAVYSLGILLKKTLEFTVFAGVLDKIVGGIVGLVQWSFTISVLLWFIKQSRLIIPVEYTKDAIIFNFLVQLAPKIIGWFQFLLPFSQDLFKLIRNIF
jgi:membrane protein required for colicin V production